MQKLNKVGRQPDRTYRLVYTDRELVPKSNLFAISRSPPVPLLPLPSCFWFRSLWRKYRECDWGEGPGTLLVVGDLIARMRHLIPKRLRLRAASRTDQFTRFAGPGQR